MQWLYVLNNCLQRPNVRNKRDHADTEFSELVINYM